MIDNPIDIGDIVYIGGLVGDDFIDVNNKIGKVEKIMFTSNDHYATYIADVLIDGKLTTINLAYIFKISKFIGVNYQMHFSGSLSDPLNYYFRNLRLVGNPTLAVDSLGRNLLFCKTRENTIQHLTLTSLN